MQNSFTLNNELHRKGIFPAYFVTVRKKDVNSVESVLSKNKAKQVFQKESAYDKRQLSCNPCFFEGEVEQGWHSGETTPS